MICNSSNAAGSVSPFRQGLQHTPPTDTTPRPLFRIRHEAQNQFLRNQSLDQPSGVGEVVLSPAPRAVALGLAQVQCAALVAGPSRFWRASFQYRAVDSITTSSTSCFTFKLKLPFHGGVSHYYG